MDDALKYIRQSNETAQWRGFRLDTKITEACHGGSDGARWSPLEPVGIGPSPGDGPRGCSVPKCRLTMGPLGFHKWPATSYSILFYLILRDHGQQQRRVCYFSVLQSLRDLSLNIACSHHVPLGQSDDNLNKLHISQMGQK